MGNVLLAKLEKYWKNNRMTKYYLHLSTVSPWIVVYEVFYDMSYFEAADKRIAETLSVEFPQFVALRCVDSAH